MDPYTSSSQTTMPMPTPVTPKNYFECSSCGLHEEYHYYGVKPPFCRSVTFLEKSYIMRNPFSKGESANFLLLGSHCGLCSKMICQDCSIYYTVRLCSDCYQTHSTALPEELRQIMRKQQKEREKNE